LPIELHRSEVALAADAPPWEGWPYATSTVRRSSMPKFLVEASLTTEGVKGVQSEGGTARREAVKTAIASLGGQLEAFYFGFGDRDVYVLADFPDNQSAAAMALAVNSSGAVTSRTVVLLSPEDVDAAAKRSVEYRAPGA
jgi:uncharacterized protein with GYD domain